MNGAERELTYSAHRIIVGHCPSPECGRPLAVFNDGEVWPPVRCPCGWSGDTLDLVNRYRLDHGWRVSDGGAERELRT